MFEQLMQRVEQMAKPSLEQVKQLVREYFVTEWQDANDVFWCMQRDKSIPASEEMTALEGNIKLLQASLADNEYGEGIHTSTQRLASDHGYSLRPLDEEYDLLCQGIVRALIQKRHILIEKIKGNFSGAYPQDPYFMGIDDPGLPPIPDTAKAPTAAASQNSQMKLAPAIDMYIKELRFRKISEKTVEDKKRSLGWAVDLLGGPDRILASITSREVRDLRHVIEHLPKSFSTNSKYKGMQIRDIITEPDIDPVDTETAIKQFGAFKSFMRWVDEQGYLEGKPSPAANISIKRIRNKGKPRYPFSHEQLVAIFSSSPLYSGCASPGRRSKPGHLIYKDSYYWIPLVGLLTGMRLGEIAQLLVSDICKSKGVWCFNVTKGEDDGSDDKRLKTDSSEREVPFHPILIQLGFLDFVEEAKKRDPKGRIFHHVKRAATGSFSSNFSKWFSRYLIATKIKTKKTSFHSFRHSFADACRIARLGDSVQKALMGHADESVSARYGSKLKAAEVVEDIKLLKFDYGLERLFPQK